MLTMRNAGASLALTTALLLAGGAVAAPANAQPLGDGLVDVTVDNVSVWEDVSFVEAAQVVADLCDVRFGRVVRTAQNVDRTGEGINYCISAQTIIGIIQNV